GTIESHDRRSAIPAWTSRIGGPSPSATTNSRPPGTSTNVSTWPVGLGGGIPEPEGGSPDVGACILVGRCTDESYAPATPTIPGCPSCCSSTSTASSIAAPIPFPVSRRSWQHGPRQGTPSCT